MTGAELLEYIRTDLLRDSAQPYLWSDELIFKYINEAQELMVRATYCLVDSTTPAYTQITTADGTAEYDLDELVLHVLSARKSTDSTHMRDWTNRVVPSHLLTTTGAPVAYNLDESQQTIRFYPTPDDTYTIYLRVARMPVESITDANSPEISRRFHMDLGEYVAYKCQIQNDVDGNNQSSADRFKASWDARVLAAKREYYRLRHGANPTAVVNWTGKRR